MKITTLTYLFHAVIILPIIYIIQNIATFILTVNKLIKQEGVETVKFKGSKITINNGEEVLNLFSVISLEAFIIWGVVAVLAIYLYCLIIKHNFIEFVSLKRIKLFPLLLWISIGLIFFLLLAWVGTVDKYFQSEFLKKLVEDDPNMLLLILSIGLFIPIAEEVLFRGYLYKVILKSFASSKIHAIAILVQSFIFTVVHIQYSLGVLLLVFLAGCALGILRWRTKSIIPSTIVHCINNSLGVYLAL